MTQGGEFVAGGGMISGIQIDPGSAGSTTVILWIAVAGLLLALAALAYRRLGRLGASSSQRSLVAAAIVLLPPLGLISWLWVEFTRSSGR